MGHVTRTLGVWCKSAEIMFAVASDGVVIDDRDHERVRAPALYEETEGLKRLLEAVGRVVVETGAERVRVLLPEQMYKGSYGSLAPRATLETLVRLAAENAEVPVELLHRNTARARVGMPKRGRFEDHVETVIPIPVGRYWAGGRKLAAIAAIAGVQS